MSTVSLNRPLPTVRSHQSVELNKPLASQAPQLPHTPQWSFGGLVKTFSVKLNKLANILFVESSRFVSSTAVNVFPQIKDPRLFHVPSSLKNGENSSFTDKVSLKIVHKLHMDLYVFPNLIMSTNPYRPQLPGVLSALDAYNYLRS